MNAVRPGRLGLVIVLQHPRVLGTEGLAILTRKNCKCQASEEAVLAQRIHRLRHAELEPLDVYLVPLGPEPADGGGLL